MICCLPKSRFCLSTYMQNAFFIIPSVHFSWTIAFRAQRWLYHHFPGRDHFWCCFFQDFKTFQTEHFIQKQQCFERKRCFQLHVFLFQCNIAFSHEAVCIFCYLSVKHRLWKSVETCHFFRSEHHFQQKTEVVQFWKSAKNSMNYSAEASCHPSSPDP